MALDNKDEEEFADKRIEILRKTVPLKDDILIQSTDVSKNTSEKNTFVESLDKPAIAITQQATQDRNEIVSDEVAEVVTTNPSVVTNNPSVPSDASKAESKEKATPVKERKKATKRAFAEYSMPKDSEYSQLAKKRKTEKMEVLISSLEMSNISGYKYAQFTSCLSEQEQETFWIKTFTNNNTDLRIFVMTTDSHASKKKPTILKSFKNYLQKQLNFCGEIIPQEDSIVYATAHQFLSSYHAPLFKFMDLQSTDNQLAFLHKIFVALHNKYNNDREEQQKAERLLVEQSKGIDVPSFIRSIKSVDLT